jgi:hypothetical protein
LEGFTIQKQAGDWSTMSSDQTGRTTATRLWRMTLKRSVPSSVKIVWPRVSKTTLCSTNRLSTPWMVMPRLKLWCTLQFFT